MDWYPWGEVAFEAARAQDKPIFLSIGYSTCHWCHVMEHESFEDSTVAALMNDAFICVKVDREERPDVDNVYMSVTQAMTGSGGWPMTVIMTPDLVPFFAGTYYPKEGRGGRPGMMELIPRMRELWEEQRDDLLSTAGKVESFLESSGGSHAGDLPGLGALETAHENLRSRFDATHGGFGSAPKFPTPHQLTLLLRTWHRGMGEDGLEMVTETLGHMRRGGIWDHVGFGFHRYSTDSQWLVPHFEKMLYDQALIAIAAAEAYQASGDPELAQTVRQIFAYVERDLTSPEGAFYSAEDADSEGEEGKFYLWSPAEVIDVLGQDVGALWNRVFDVTESGNFRDPHTGKSGSIPHLSQSVTGWSDELGIGEDELGAKLEHCRTRLLEARSKRIRPFRDDKVLTDWNGLMIAGLAVGARVLDEPEYAARAQRAADFIWTHLRSESGELQKRWRRGHAGLHGTLEDYAFLAWGLLELYESNFELRNLENARSLAREMVRLFADEEGEGFFLAADGRDDLLVRPKEGYDGALPSGNSVAALVLWKLGRVTADADFEARAEGVLRAFGRGLSQAPLAFTQMLGTLDLVLGPAHEVVIAGDAGASDVQAMLQGLHSSFVPRKVVVLRTSGDAGKALAKLAAYTEAQRPVDGKATAYVCRNYACLRPMTDPAEVVAALRNPAPDGAR